MTDIVVWLVMFLAFLVVLAAATKAKPIFAWYDLWVGFFWDGTKRKLYFFPVPCLGLVFQFAQRALPRDLKAWETGK